MSTVNPAPPAAVRSPNSGASLPEGALEGAKRVLHIEGRSNPAANSQNPISGAHIEIQKASV